MRGVLTGVACGIIVANAIISGELDSPEDRPSRRVRRTSDSRPRRAPTTTFPARGPRPAPRSLGRPRWARLPLRPGKSATCTAIAGRRVTGTGRGRLRERVGTTGMGANDDGARATDERLQAAMAYLQREFRRGPTLPEAAKAAHLSPYHFHRLFRQHFGKTPKQVMVELQIAEAQKLMLAGVPLAKAAKRAGFAQQSHLSTRFKKVTGLTPGQWLLLTKVKDGKR